MLHWTFDSLIHKCISNIVWLIHLELPHSYFIHPLIRYCLHLHRHKRTTSIEPTYEKHIFESVKIESFWLIEKEREKWNLFIYVRCQCYTFEAVRAIPLKLSLLTLSITLSCHCLPWASHWAVKARQTASLQEALRKKYLRRKIVFMLKIFLCLVREFLNKMVKFSPS